MADRLDVQDAELSAALRALRRALKASADDEFTLLLAVGSDTAGDVQVFEAGRPPVAARPLLEIPSDLTAFSFTAALESAHPFDRIGLPGVQDKVSGRMINLPAARRGEPLIRPCRMVTTPWRWSSAVAKNGSRATSFSASPLTADCRRPCPRGLSTSC
jgi:hypothetical protein